MEVRNTDIRDLEARLDEVAERLEESLQKLIPGADFSFTHDAYWIYKRSVELIEDLPMPIVQYYPVKDLTEITPKSHLLIIASVKVFGRKQTVQVRCIVYTRGRGKIGLECDPDKPVDIIDVEYYPGEEKEKRDKGRVVFPWWVRDYQEFIGALLVAGTEIGLALLGLKA